MSSGVWREGDARSGRRKVDGINFNVVPSLTAAVIYSYELVTGCSWSDIM